MKPEPLQGFILAAGLGTRMGPLSKILPKPAWTLRGRPLIAWGLQCLRDGGLTRVACNAHHLAHRIHEAAKGLEGLCVFDEPVLLGSAGGLSHVKDFAADPLAVWNGDALAEVPWAPFLEAHRRLDAELSWLLVPHEGGPWNPVFLDEGGRVLTEGQTSNRGPYHFTGAALWSSKALDLVPEGYADTKADLLPRLRRHMGVVVEPFPWREIGTPADLVEAAAERAPDLEGRLPGCYVHPTATPQGVLERCVLGPGACPHPAVQDADALWFEEAGHQVRLSLGEALSSSRA